MNLDKEEVFCKNVVGAEFWILWQKSYLRRQKMRGAKDENQ